MLFYFPGLAPGFLFARAPLVRAPVAVCHTPVGQCQCHTMSEPVSHHPLAISD